MDSQKWTPDPEVEKLKKGIQHCFQRLRPTAPYKIGWSDTLLHKLREPLQFDKNITIREMQRKVFRRFYELYFQGIVSKEDAAFSIVADAIALAQTVNGNLWKPTQFGEKPFYPINRSKEEYLPENVTGTLAILVSDMTLAEQETALTTVFCEKNRNEFYSKISSMIRNFSKTKEEIQLKRLTGFLALTLMRASTKNANQLRNAFLKTQYRTNLNVLAGWPNEFPFFPPCNACINICIEYLTSGLSTTSSMFTLLASEYVLSRQPEYQDPAVSRYLDAAVLTHTAKYGLGMIELVEQAVAITGLELIELRKKALLMVHNTECYWNLIEDFFRTYQDKERPQYGFNWARIINVGYLRYYSPKDMLPLAGIFAGIIEQQQGPGIWDAKWAKEYVGFINLNQMRIYGKHIFEMTRKRQEVEKVHDEN